MQDTVQFWRDPSIGHVEIRLARGQRHAFPRHTHDAYAIGVMEHGACWCLKPGAANGLVTTNGIACINPGQVHSGVPVGSDAPTYRMFYIDASWMRDVAADLCEAPRAEPECRRMVVDDPRLLASLGQLALAFARSHDPLAKETALLRAVGRLLTHHAAVRPAARRARPEPRAVRLAKEYLAAHVADKIPLDTLASASGLSKFHLLRVFKQSVGLPPHSFQMQRRVELARALMRQGMPLAQVAAEAGFADQSHLCHTFKRLVGAPPSRYLDA
ncbi:MAG: helix-turn-helix domain-containing protein [Desulfovibrionaceae bacterium]